jgi:hypothetical protein
MKINLKKLDATIAKLSELRRLATDPALSDFIEVTGVKPAPNGSATQMQLQSNGNGHGALKGNVLAACRALGERHFTIKDVFSTMQQMENFESGSEKSVANVLRLLAEDGDLQVIVRGQGRRATVYGNRI